MKEEIVQSPATGVHRKLRKTGILAIGDVPWGTHFCQFYQTKEDLLNILVPYFKAGLGNNESCMWVTSEPLTLEEAKKAMRKAVPEFDRCLERGQIEIIPHTEWYLKDGAFNQKRVLNGWIDKLNEALAKGYNGLRLTGNTFWLERKDWKDFANYEEKVNSVIGKYRMIAICTYSLDKCSASEVIDVVRNHQFALIKRIGKWELIESSEIKRMKEALVRSELMFEDVLAASPEAITTSDLNGNIVDCNQAKLNVHGFSSKEEVIGKSVFEFIAEKDRQRAVENLKKTTEQEAVRNIKYTFLTKDGREFLGELSASVIKDSLGNLIGFLYITKDITERKKAELALRESEEKYRNLVENSKDSIVIIDLKGNVQFGNTATEELTGYTREEGLGINVRKITPLRYWPKSLAMLLMARKGEQIPYFESMIRRKDGRLIPVESGGQAIFKDGKVIGIQIITRDISERRLAEEKIRESEEKYRSLFELAPDSIMTFNMKGVVTSCNTAATIMSGYSKDELVGKHFSKMAAVRVRDIPKYLKIFTSIVRGKMPKPFEIVWKDKNGTPHFGEVHCSLMKEKDKLVGTQVIMRDITEHKKADEAIRQSETRYRSLYEAISSGIVVQDHEGRIIEANDMACEILGLTRDQMQGRTSMDPRWRAIHEDGSPFPGNEHPAMITLRTGKRIRNTIMGVFHPNDGAHRWIQINSEPVIDPYNPNVKGVMTTFLDITERKKMEEALRESEEKYRMQFEEALDAIVVADAETGIMIDCNRAASELVGREKSELVGKHQRILHPPEEIEGDFSRTYKQHLKEKEGQILETQVITKKGEIKDVAIKANVIELRGKKLIQGIFRDITERKKAELALRESEEKHRKLFEESMDAIFVVDAETGVIIDCNRASSELVGREKSELIGEHERILNPRQEIEGGFSRIFKHHPKGQRLESQVITKEGEIRNVSIKARLIEFRDKKMLHGTFRDITERKKAEEALREEEQRFRDIVTNTGDWMWETDPEGKYTYVSPMVEQLLGYKPEEVLGKYFHDFFVPEEKEQLKEAAFNVFSDRGRFRGFVNRNIHKNGEIVFLETSGVPIFDNDGKFLGYRGTDHNVTESKIMEEHLSALNFYGGMLSSAKSLPQIYELTLDAMQQLLGSEYFTFATIDRGILRPIYQRGYPEPTNFELPLDGTKKGITVKVAQTWASVLAYNVGENKDYVELANGIRSELAVPIVVDEKVVGVLNAESKKLGAFNQKHEVMLQVLAWNVATAMSNVRNLEEIEKYSQQLEKLIEKRTEQLAEVQAQLVKSERLAAIGELAAMVGHDLRNPLQSIENAAYYLNSELSNLSASVPISQKTMEMLKVINDSINHADKIIRDLQDFSATKKPILKKTDINAIVKETMSQFLIPKNVKLISELDRLPKIKADKNQMKRVFLNLTSNALQAMENGGTLTVSTKRANGFVEVSFKDTGAGIAKENIEKLFNPFFTTRAQGMGMGLPICKKFVESHGGSIEVETEEGKGSTFIVKLPLPRENGGENP